LYETQKSYSSSPLSRDSGHGDVYRRTVSIEIARRLLASGSMTSAQAQDALMLHAKRSVPLLRALRDSGVSSAAIDRESHRADVPRLQHVVPLHDVVESLPSGMCDQFLAIPVRVDAMTSTVDVAMADPFDTHAQQEFAFHLDAPVRVVHAPLTVIERALEGLATAGPRRRLRTPALGSASPRFDAPTIQSSSDVPIPLVRRSRSPVMTDGTEDAGRITRDAIVLDPGSLPAARPSLADLSANALDGVAIESLHVVIPRSAALPQIEEAPETLPLLMETVVGLETALDDLECASTRDDIVLAALRGMVSVARRVGVFAVRRDAFTGWACTPSFATADEFRGIRIARHKDSVFSHAASEGWFFGAIPRNAVHEPLHSLLSHEDTEVTIVAVRIQGRAAMLILGAELIDTLIATRTAERVAHASAKALLRVLRSEKRQDR
jgi:hypothetical protein